MYKSNFYELKNGGNAPLSLIPSPDFSEFRESVLHAVLDGGCRISSFFAVPAQSGTVSLYAVLLDPAAHVLKLCRTDGIAKSYRSLTMDAPAFHWFEREIAEQTGIIPEGHPWLKPIRFHNSPAGKRPDPGVTDYFTMHGAAAHEVAVGPVHAGVIEPGHFRFQCMGEDVYSLEIELGYQHRGIENMLTGGPDRKTYHLIETAAGDTTASSDLCFAMMMEGFAANFTPSARTLALRTAALELERIANHVGDLGALAGDVAFLSTSSYCGRIRGEFLNMTAQLCGNRFGRGFIHPGGIAWDLDDAEAANILAWLLRSRKELEDALDLMFDAPSVLDRFENTGAVSTAAAARIGLAGPAARASGLRRDVRTDLPYGQYMSNPIKIRTAETGDVFARALIRRLELADSLDLVQNILGALPSGSADTTELTTALPPNTIAAASVEAWRGELCHTMITDASGKFLRYKIVDPSFHNWFGLALALRKEQISNFPICNKSFNLSYCGHDL